MGEKGKLAFMRAVMTAIPDSGASRSPTPSTTSTSCFGPTMIAIMPPMAPETVDLLSNALALPAKERARIAHQLLLSLDEGADPDAAEAWVAELEQRAREVRSGTVATEEWVAVKAQLAKRWRRP